MTVTRREFVYIAGLSAVAAAIDCRESAIAAGALPERLVIPTGRPTVKADYGRTKLGLGTERDGSLYVPKSYAVDKLMPLLILLHGAGQSAELWFGSWGERAEANGMILLVPDSRGMSWDAIRGDFGEDVAFINDALKYVFARCNVDRRRIALVGFSDGASYAISLGLTNGDLTPNIVAFSPGFVIKAPPRGTPSFWISHGTSDQILPIDRTSRPLVASLRRAGYTTEFMEFDGRHQVPPEIGDKALVWLKSRQAKV